MRSFEQMDCSPRIRDLHSLQRIERRLSSLKNKHDHQASMNCSDAADGCRRLHSPSDPRGPEKFILTIRPAHTRLRLAPALFTPHSRPLVDFLERLLRGHLSNDVRLPQRRIVPFSILHLDVTQSGVIHPRIVCKKVLHGLALVADLLTARSDGQLLGAPPHHGECLPAFCCACSPGGRHPAPCWARSPRRARGASSPGCPASDCPRGTGT
mmetsp:Transcript_15194/g.37068  ORF Transcript_15194/g.37068 Transcript_15194/m.37068 type:complete len:211 (+) Transcript_15194:1100-1732(+)